MLTTFRGRSNTGSCRVRRGAVPQDETDRGRMSDKTEPPRSRNRELSSSVLHARARESAAEFRKLLISLGTGSLAAFYISLTSKVDPPLTQFQRSTAIGSAVGFGICVLAGAVQWRADVKRNYHWAKALEGNS